MFQFYCPKSLYVTTKEEEKNDTCLSFYHIRQCVIPLPQNKNKQKTKLKFHYGGTGSKPHKLTSSICLTAGFKKLSLFRKNPNYSIYFPLSTGTYSEYDYRFNKYR